jgi:hypothetical protein
VGPREQQEEISSETWQAWRGVQEELADMSTLARWAHGRH